MFGMQYALLLPRKVRGKWVNAAELMVLENKNGIMAYNTWCNYRKQAMDWSPTAGHSLK